MLKRIIFIASFLFVVFVASNTASAQRLLGSRDIADRVDHDSIPVTGWRGDLRRIKFRVTQNPVRIYRCMIIYRNGGRQRCAINALIPRGGETRWINLVGNERVINRVDIWYDAKTPGWYRGRARVWLYGLD